MSEINNLIKDLDEKKRLIRKQKVNIEHLEDEAEEYRDDKHVFTGYQEKIEEEKQRLKDMHIDYKKTRSDASLRKVTGLIIELDKEKKKLELEIRDLDLELKQTSNEYLKFLSNPIGTEKNQTIILINKIIYKKVF